MKGRMPVAGRRVVVVGLAVLAASLWVTSALGASTNLSGTVSVGGTPYNKSIPVSQAGRFQVVNGTPEITRNIMLLDSVTGEAWIYCDHQGGVPGWCYMPRSSTAASKN